MKGTAKKEDVPKERKTRKHSWQCTTTEEAKAACKTRKRKERQESISSLCQERKVIRSNSEERPQTRKYSEKETIRRFSSSEDLHIENEKNKKQSQKDNLDLELECCEHEKRRSHERFAKPLSLKCKKFTRKPKGKTFHYKILNNKSQNDSNSKVDIEIYEVAGLKTRKDRSPSPSLDLTTLHRQVDDSDPLPSCSSRVKTDDIDDAPSLSVVPNRLLSSPRNSIIATQSIYSNPDVVYNTVRRTIVTPLEEKLQKINKQLNTVKKKIKRYENEYYIKHGCKPTHLDRLSDNNVRKCYLDMAKLKKECKIIQEMHEGQEGHLEHVEVNKKKTLSEAITEIELKLKAKRESSKRTSAIEEMSSDELMEEKIAMQKALLHLENIYGRPNEKGDRDLVRPLYDRYRTLKRLVTKAALGTAMSNDLETIHEDETIHFTIDSAKSSDTPTDKTSTISQLTDSDTDVSISENLHSMSQEELRAEMKTATEEKKILKRTIKEHEAAANQSRNTKVAPKDDRTHLEQMYKKYKTVKSKIRLLDALIAKQN